MVPIHTHTHTHTRKNTEMTPARVIGMNDVVCIHTYMCDSCVYTLVYPFCPKSKFAVLVLWDFMESLWEGGDEVTTHQGRVWVLPTDLSLFVTITCLRVLVY